MTMTREEWVEWVLQDDLEPVTEEWLTEIFGGPDDGPMISTEDDGRTRVDTGEAYAVVPAEMIADRGGMRRTLSGIGMVPVKMRSYPE